MELIGYLVNHPLISIDSNTCSQ